MSFAPISIQLARHKNEFEGAFELLQKSRESWHQETDGKNSLWLLKHHALPSTNTIVALQGDRVVGAICLFGESPFQLPLEGSLNLKSFRENLEGRLAELSLPGIHPDFNATPDLQNALYHFATCFGSSYCHFDGFVTHSPIRWAERFAAELHFKKIFEPMENRQLLFLNSRDELNFKGKISPEFQVSFQFPEKKFFLVAHQSMQPEVLNYLFNERTKLFSTLSDGDLRVLKNIYDYGEFSKVLPHRSLDLPEKKTPRYPRFPMNCDGYLVDSNGNKEHVQVLDVSREGLKVRVGMALDQGKSYVLTLFVGVNKKTELIASTIWADDLSEIAGLEIRSSDENWQQLISYLEKDFLRVA